MNDNESTSVEEEGLLFTEAALVQLINHCKTEGKNNGVSSEELNNKVDKIEGKGLSTNDYTDEEKSKLAGLSNYDDTSLSNRVTSIEDIIPTSANSENNLATIGDIPEVREKYTPAGVISQPEASLPNKVTTTVNSIVSVGTLPSMSVTDEILSFDYGALPEKGSNQTVVAAIGEIVVSQPTFTGTEATISSIPIE